jgi:hypothetical protein
VIEIFLPHTDGGFYRFGDLPELIANSRCPDDSTLKPWIKAVLSWLDDGSKEGVMASKSRMNRPQLNGPPKRLT